MLETKCQENARAIAQQMKNSGGSGADVTVTQILSTGTKIATITVGEESTDLYCETAPTSFDADDVVYDNTTSGLTATDVQSAIDELAEGGGSGFALTTVWTNSTPTNAFAGQKIAVDLTAYSVVIVEYIASIGTTDVPHRCCSTLTTKDSTIYFNSLYFSGAKHYTRLVSFDSTGVTFIDALEDATQNNNRMIPIKIYGI